MRLLSPLRDLLGRFGASRLDEDLRDSVAWAVDLVEPRLRQIGGFPQRYAPAIVHASAYCRELAARVPGPLDVNRQAFAQDELVHALFGSPDGIIQALARSPAVRDWQQAHPGGGMVYALMGVRPQERNIFGMETQGEHLQRDVPQKVVYFSDHVFNEVAASEADARANLARRFLESLLVRVKARIDELVERKRELENRRDEVRAQLRTRRDDAGLQAQLAETLAQLGETVAGLDLRAYAAHFDAVLMHPEHYIHLDPRSFHLDAMGICRADIPDGDGQDLNLQEMTCRDQRRWGIMLTRLQLDDLPPYQVRLDSEGRWLAI